MKKIIFTILLIIVNGCHNWLFYWQYQCFAIISLLIMTLTFMCFLIISFLLNLLLKNEYVFFNKIFGCITSILAIAIFMSFITLKINIEKKQKAANNILVNLMNHKNKFGTYPINIDDFNIKNKELVEYYVYRNKLDFTLKFNRDGWHNTTYFSESNKWISGD
jgi:hypothetical protein